MDSRKDPTSAVLHALRYTSDEVQLGRVLAAVCQDQAVAHAFVKATLSTAKGGDPSVQRRARKVPDSVTCLDEQNLKVRVGRTSARRRSKDAGRVDLEFGSSDSAWKLAIELKLGSGFQVKQLERYQSADIPVAAIVRDRSSVPTDVASHGRWAGVSTWNELLPHLRSLPLVGEERQDWLRFLATVQREHDFEPAGPGRPVDVEAALAMLHEIAAGVLEHFSSALAKKHKAEADAVRDAMQVLKPRAGKGPWAGFGIGVRGQGAWLWFRVRNFHERAPTLGVDYYSFTDAWAKHKLKQVVVLLERRGFQRWDDGTYRYQAKRHDLAAARADGFREAFAERVTALVGAGAFELDIRRMR